MLYEKIDGELQPITTQPKQVRKLIGNELVGKNQIDWGKDEALQAIILKYPKSQKGQSSILGLILYQVLFEDASSNYEITRRGHSVRYYSF